MGSSGTCLGMAVLWGSVKDHHGYIDVNSKEGIATIFTVYFPATRKHRPDDQTTHAIKDYMGNGEVVLVVEDVTE